MDIAMTETMIAIGQTATVPTTGQVISTSSSFPRHQQQPPSSSSFSCWSSDEVVFMAICAFVS
jgi:hypothetical protein